MENIQIQAKDQLLNIEDVDQNFYQQSFFFNVPPVKQKNKNKSTARVLTSLSSHRDIPIFQTQNNKKQLKDKLKKLLQKDIESPKSHLKRIKTIGSLESNKNADRIHDNFKIFSNQNQSKRKEFPKSSILSLRKQNISLSQKTLIPLETRQKMTKSLFEEESQQIRKFIKKKMEEKTQQKRRKNIVSANMIESLHKIKESIKDKNKVSQQNDQFTLIKLRIKNKDIQQDKISLKNDNMWIKNNNKQNLIGISAISSPLIKLYKQKTYECRKLRDILF